MVDRPVAVCLPVALVTMGAGYRPALYMMRVGIDPIELRAYSRPVVYGHGMATKTVHCCPPLRVRIPMAGDNAAGPARRAKRIGEARSASSHYVIGLVCVVGGVGDA